MELFKTHDALSLESLREQIAATKKRNEMREKYRVLFGSDLGREVLADMCERAGVGKSAFVPGDTTQTNFQLGVQHHMLSILRLMGEDPFTFISILRRLGVKTPARENPADTD